MPAFSASTSLPCNAIEADRFLSTPTPGALDFCKRAQGDFMILGAGGKMGLHVAAMLKRGLDVTGRSNRVVAVSRFRSVNERADFAEFGIETLACDLCDEAQLAKLEPVENVIFMAGAKFGTADRPDMLRLMNVEMPWRVAQHFHGSKITAFSTGCVYSFVQSDSRGASEQSETAPIGAYAQSCLGRENSFTQAAREFGTPITLLRLNYSVEFRYGVLVDIASKVLAEEPIDVSMGYFNAIWQRDAVSHSLQAHAHSSSAPFIVNVTGSRVLGIRGIAQEFGKCFGKEPVFTGVEAETAWLSDPSKSHGLFGEPETSTEQMVEWVAAWLQAGYPTFGKPTGFEKRDGNF